MTWEEVVLLNYCVYTEAALPVLDFSQMLQYRFHEQFVR